jgi:hypothetical protein
MQAGSPRRRSRCDGFPWVAGERLLDWGRTIRIDRRWQPIAALILGFVVTILAGWAVAGARERLRAGRDQAPPITAVRNEGG